MGRTWSVRTHTAVDAREGPVSPHSHCGRWHGEDLISPHSHCSRMHGEDLISPHSHCSLMHGKDLSVHTPTAFDGMGRTSLSTLTLQSNAWGGPDAQTECLGFILIAQTECLGFISDSSNGVFGVHSDSTNGVFGIHSDSTSGVFPCMHVTPRLYSLMSPAI